MLFASFKFEFLVIPLIPHNEDMLFACQNPIYTYLKPYKTEFSNCFWNNTHTRLEMCTSVQCTHYFTHAHGMYTHIVLRKCVHAQASCMGKVSTHAFIMHIYAHRCDTCMLKIFVLLQTTSIGQKRIHNIYIYIYIYIDALLF